MDKIYTLEELLDLGAGTKIICDSIPFTMVCSFFTYENWEVQIIRHAIEFKKKYGKWPNFITANPITYDNCIAEIDKIRDECEKRKGKVPEWIKKFDWNTFDINEPIEKYPIEFMPLRLHEGLFITPIFTILLLDCKSYQESIYKLSLGTNPGPDDGEDIEESDNDEPLKIRLVA